MKSSPIAALLCGLCLAGCTANPRAVPSADNGLPHGALPAGQSVVLMDALRLTTVGGGPALETTGVGGGREATTEIGGRLSAAGLPVIDLAGLGGARGSQAEAALSRLRQDMPVLLSAFRDKGPVRPALAELRQASGASLLCVSRVQERPGLGGMYDPNSGMIHETTSSFDVKVVLISLDDGKIAWGNEVYVRQPLNSSSWSQSMSTLFDTTPH